MSKQVLLENKGFVIFENAILLAIFFPIILTVFILAEHFYSLSTSNEILEQALSDVDYSAMQTDLYSEKGILKVLGAKIKDKLDSHFDVTEGEWYLELVMAELQQDRGEFGYDIQARSFFGNLKNLTGFLRHTGLAEVVGNLSKDLLYFQKINTKFIPNEKNQYFKTTFLLYSRLIIDRDGGFSGLLRLLGLESRLVSLKYTPLRMNMELYKNA